MAHIVIIFSQLIHSLILTDFIVNQNLSISNTNNRYKISVQIMFSH